MIVFVILNIDSAYSYLIKNLKLNQKNTSYKAETLGLNFYNITIKSYDKKANISKILKRLKELEFSQKDSFFLKKFENMEITELYSKIMNDTLIINFKLRTKFGSIFERSKLENFFINLIESSTSLKIDKKKVNSNLETKSDFYNLKMSIKNSFSQDDITKIRNSMLKDNIYALDYQLGRLIYIRFSGLIENYLIYDSYIKYLQDSLFLDIKIKKPELKTVRVAKNILYILKLASKDKIIGYGFKELWQDVLDNKIVNTIKLDVIFRKDVVLEEIKNRIVNEGSRISINKNAYVVSEIIVISNPQIEAENYKTIRIEFSNFSEYDIFKVGTINVEVQ
ncbi:MAG: hypothetical protein RMJ38_02145 [candidate division WOR-3 bacterium]|nr:hypothetical protein [candidate division WOR-3 bacterium]MDW8150233.1 hypothetical protein [candidate division WOR-3 bacterium]